MKSIDLVLFLSNLLIDLIIMIVIKVCYLEVLAWIKVK